MIHNLTTGLAGDICCSYLSQGLVGDKKNHLSVGGRNSPFLLPLHLPRSQGGTSCCLQPEDECRRNRRHRSTGLPLLDEVTGLLATCPER